MVQSVWFLDNKRWLFRSEIQGTTGDVDVDVPWVCARAILVPCTYVYTYVCICVRSSGYYINTTFSAQGYVVLHAMFSFRHHTKVRKMGVDGAFKTADSVYFTACCTE